MFNRSFETSAGSAVFPVSLPGKIILAKAEGTLVPVAGYDNFFALVERNIKTKDIPTFNSPFLLTNTEGTSTFINMIPYKAMIRRDETGALVPPVVGAPGILMRRALLETVWDSGIRDPFFFNIDVPLTIFSRWLSGLLRNNLTLSDAVATKVEALTAYYFYCLHVKKEDLNQRLLEVFAVKINRILRVPFQTLIDWFEPIGYLNNLDDYAKALKKFGESMSFRNIDKRVIWNLTSTSWFGSMETKEMVAISLEHPPTFISMIYSAATEKTYRKAFLTQLVEKEGRRLNTADFASRVDDIIRSVGTNANK